MAGPHPPGRSVHPVMNSVMGPPEVPAGSPSIDKSSPKPSARADGHGNPGAGLVQLPAGDGLDVGYRESNRIRRHRPQLREQVQPASITIYHGPLDLRSPLELRGEAVDSLLEHAEPHGFARRHTLHAHLGIGVAAPAKGSASTSNTRSRRCRLRHRKGGTMVPVFMGEHLGRGLREETGDGAPPKVISWLKEVTLDAGPVGWSRQQFAGNDCPKECTTPFPSRRPARQGPPVQYHARQELIPR